MNSRLELKRGFFLKADEMYKKWEGPGVGFALNQLVGRGYVAVLDCTTGKMYKIDRKKIRTLHNRYKVIYETGNLALAVIPVSALEEVKPDTRSQEEKDRARFYGDE